MAIKLKDVHIANCKVGIRSEGPITAVFENVTFSNVEKPFDIRGASDIRASGTRVSDASVRADRNTSRVGYTGRNGPPLPAYCPNCHSVFPSAHYDIGSSAFYGFDNEEVCQNPRCRYEHAKLANGLFDLAKETVRVLQAEPLTHAMLATVSSAAADFLNQKVEAEAAVASIEGVSKRLGAMFAAALKFGEASAALLALWFVIFPSHLASLKQFLGENESESQRNYQIERVCFEAFGEAASCRFIVEPIAKTKVDGDVDVRGVDYLANRKADADQTTDALTRGNYVDLPAEGPLPSSRPSK